MLRTWSALQSRIVGDEQGASMVEYALLVALIAVVVIGGFGSILGTFFASILVGVVYAFSILIWPDGALAVVFLIVIAVLIWRPWGLFGTELRQ